MIPLRLGLLALCSGVLFGCQTTPFPSDLRRQVDESLAFAEVSLDPDRYQGKLVLWGGGIIETRNTGEGAEIEVLQRPLERNDRPVEGDESGGRFLVIHDGFLDPAIYMAGREITVVAEVLGKRVQALDEIEYTYSVVQARDIALWSTPRNRPSIHFGFGTTIVR